MTLPRLIAFTGYKGHGKDTAASVLTEFHGYQRINFADALKAMLATMLRYGGMSEGQIYRAMEGDMKEVPIYQYGDRSVRHMMQTLGTEWGRNLISQDIWTTLFQSMAEEALRHRPVCVTDLRFKNEAKLIHGMKGTIIHVHDIRKRHTDVHASESEIFQIDADIALTNDGTIPELQVDLMAKLAALS